MAVTYAIPPKNRPYKRNVIFHFVNGIHSGIPLCCTTFFSLKTLDEKCHREGIAFTVSEEREPGAWETGTHTSVNYVQCDKCWERGHVVEIKETDYVPLLWLRKDDEYDL